jgi:hypothetical protein
LGLRRLPLGRRFRLWPWPFNFWQSVRYDEGGTFDFVPGIIGLLAIAGALAYAIPTIQQRERERVVGESPQSPGYSIVRAGSLQDDIESYQSVKPDPGWATQYEIEGRNETDLVLRFRGPGGGQELSMSYPDYSEPLAREIRKVARAKGFQER